MTCTKCGHPRVVETGYTPHPDPLGIRAANPPRCLFCQKSLLRSTHHWEAESDKGTVYLCCDCYATRLRGFASASLALERR